MKMKGRTARERASHSKYKVASIGPKSHKTSRPRLGKTIETTRDAGKKKNEQGTATMHADSQNGKPIVRNAIVAFLLAKHLHQADIEGS